MATTPHPRSQQVSQAQGPTVDTQEPVVEAPKALKPEMGKVSMMRAVYGHMHHPFQVPLTFDTDRVTKVEADNWVLIQFEAGKLAMAD